MNTQNEAIMGSGENQPLTGSSPVVGTTFSGSGFCRRDLPVCFRFQLLDFHAEQADVVAKLVVAG
ncbi:MAG: hypothetical protein P4L50_00755, partial [Anaerolineaceae bacterium]|nr:hypothetical protein [Anaerolineaceae bacterium]